MTHLNGYSYLGNEAFAGCTNLQGIPDDLLDYDAQIGYSVFANCTGLKSVEINFPSYMGAIGGGESMFTGCTGLESVTLWGGFVPDYAFSGCTSLKSVTGLYGVRSGAFSGCTSLANITVGGTLFEGAFYGCSSLTHVEMWGDPPRYFGTPGGEPPGPFDGTPATIYYHYGTSGWGPTYAGHPTVMLGGPTATFTGQVTCLYDNSPVVGATVQIGSYSGTTDGNGKYSISSIPFGSYTATVSKANYETLTTSVDLGQATVTQNFSLTPDAALALLVVRAEPAEGGMVIGGGSFPIDSWQQISAGPSPGWRFVMWEENFSPAMTQRVQVPKEGATYTAKFEPIQDSELSPELNPVVIQGHSLILSWPTLTLPGVRVVYQVERRADLNSGDWEVVAPNLEATELNNISVTLPISGMQGYFRVGAIRIVAP